MSKDKISDYSQTANSNTDIGGINVDEGCAPSGINDAIRTLMKQLKDWQSGSQDVYIHPAGSASVPSITATGDTNTGLFFPAADTVGITTGGTERARVDSSGNLGLGVTPSAWSGAKAFQTGSGGVATTALWDLSNNTFLTNGAYWNGSNYIYVANSFPAARYVQTSGAHTWSTAAGGTAGNAITFTQAMTLDASGGLKTLNTIGVGNTAPATSGAGITFPATQSASTDANTLDDYEEGTWTPVIDSEVSGTGRATTINSARYVKVGRLVWVQLYVTMTTLGSGGSGAWIVGGLPFQSTASTVYAGVSCGFFDTLNSAVTFLSGTFEPNSTTILVRGTTAAQVNITNLSFSTYVKAGTSFIFSGCYLSAS